jgi:hypothetical protein
VAEAVTIALDRLHVPLRLKKVLTDEQVQAAAEAYLDHGLEDPIEVRPDGERFVVVTGAEWVEAARALGETVIDVVLVTPTSPSQKPVPSYESAAESERTKMERLRKLRVQREAADAQRAGMVSPAAPKRESKKPARTPKSRTLADWLAEQEESGGRF